ncbi:MAG: DUF1992 domain-containing protein [Planctomycetes bacterium]|nr:DUF1992 domain-containing protein [Planctomycetota bacterium]
MNDSWSHLVEQRIAEAQRRGDFERLPGRGRPLVLEDLSGVPAELRASYILLKTHGFLPPELEARKAWLRLEDLVAACAETSEREQLRGEARQALLRYRLLVEQRGGIESTVAAEYQEAVLRRLGGDPDR